MSLRTEILNRSHIITQREYIDDLSRKNRLIYNGSPDFVIGTEFLSSNEFDSHRSNRPYLPADIIVGFGTNALWDLALRTGARSMLIADWSPWPVIAHAFILEPLFRLAETAQELVFLVSGMPPSLARGLSLAKVFELAKKFTLAKTSEQNDLVMQLLQELAKKSEISEIELKCLTTYFRPRMGYNLNAEKGYGPFPNLKTPNLANFPFYFDQRYNPTHIGPAETVLSSQKNFEFVKSIFQNNQTYYSITTVNDIKWYETLLTEPRFLNFKKIAVSFTNIFSCGYYNGLDNESMYTLIDKIASLDLNRQFSIYRTHPKDAPYEYFTEKRN